MKSAPQAKWTAFPTGGARLRKFGNEFERCSRQPGPADGDLDDGGCENTVLDSREGRAGRNGDILRVISGVCSLFLPRRAYDIRDGRIEPPAGGRGLVWFVVSGFAFSLFLKFFIFSLTLERLAAVEPFPGRLGRAISSSA